MVGIGWKMRKYCVRLGLTIDPEIGRVVRGLVAAVAVLPPYLYSVFNIDEEDILGYKWLSGTCRFLT
jgi:hypothetical protein